MNFTNINDPAGVKALLDQLRSSQAWQETLSQPATHSSESSSSVSNGSMMPPEDPVSTGTILPTPASSVAALLSRLQAATSQIDPQSGVFKPPLGLSLSRSAEDVASRSRIQDLRSLTSQQALPHLVQLADDPNFISSINQMKEEQAGLEQKLWSERQAIYKKYEDKVKVSRAKADMMGTGLTKHEADMLTEAFQKELCQFDLERVLPAWDGLVTKQQSALEGQGVPAMFVTTRGIDRERQQSVMKILEGIMG